MLLSCCCHGRFVGVVVGEGRETVPNCSLMILPELVRLCLDVIHREYEGGTDALRQMWVRGCVNPGMSLRKSMNELWILWGGNNKDRDVSDSENTNVRIPTVEPVREFEASIKDQFLHM